MSLIDFIEHNNKFCLSLHYNEANSFLFVKGKEIHKFKAKDSEIVAVPLCLGNIIDFGKRKFVELYFNEQSRM